MSKKGHPTKSFDQYIQDAQSKAMEKIIEQKVAVAGQAIFQSVHNLILQERAAMQTRQLAFERLLTQRTDWFNEDVLAMAVAEVEDEASGYVTLDTPVVEGNKVRADLWVKASGEHEFSTSGKIAIHSVMTKNPKTQLVQTHEALEQAVLGMRAGETKEFQFAEPIEDGKEPQYSMVKVHVKRVSGPKPAEAAASNA